MNQPVSKEDANLIILTAWKLREALSWLRQHRKGAIPKNDAVRGDKIKQFSDARDNLKYIADRLGFDAKPLIFYSNGPLASMELPSEVDVLLEQIEIRAENFLRFPPAAATPKKSPTTKRRKRSVGK